MVIAPSLTDSSQNAARKRKLSISITITPQPKRVKSEPELSGSGCGGVSGGAKKPATASGTSGTASPGGEASRRESWESKGAEAKGLGYVWYQYPEFELAYAAGKLPTFFQLTCSLMRRDTCACSCARHRRGSARARRAAAPGASCGKCAASLHFAGDLIAHVHPTPDASCKPHHSHPADVALNDNLHLSRHKPSLQ